METDKKEKIPRRNFFRMLFGSVIGLAGAATVPFVISSVIPRKVIENRRVPIGKPADFPLNQMTFLSQPRLFIFRDHSGIAAMSAVCTHLGCVVDKDASGFLCPCHGSSYSPDGAVTTGPAPRSLPWYKVMGLPDKSLLVDIDQNVSPETRFFI